MTKFIKPIPKIDPIPLTQEELDKKKLELKKLLVTQKEVITRLQIAREMGDLSENGAYHAAKHELGNTRRQLRKVRHILKHGYVPKTTSAQAVAFGKTVTLKTDHKELTFTLVSHYESNPLKGKLSMESPIGQAIINKKVGDEVVVSTPKGEVKYVVVEIK